MRNPQESAGAAKKTARGGSGLSRLDIYSAFSVGRQVWAQESQAGRILPTSSSHNCVAARDPHPRVTTVAGLSGVDAERGMDTEIVYSKIAISRTRASIKMLVFEAGFCLCQRLRIPAQYRGLHINSSVPDAGKLYELG
jgi:hypothetical protein